MPSERTIKKHERFERELREAVPPQEVREDVETAIRFAVRHFPEGGKFTGRSAPLPIFAWTLQETDRNPALTVYYCFDAKTVILLSVKVVERG